MAISLLDKILTINCHKKLLTPSHVLTGHVHQNTLRVPICSDFRLGKCKNGSRCSGHHCSLPFHWQYKVPDVDEWKSFSETDNEKLEAIYRDVMLEEFSAIDFQIFLEFDGFFLLDEGYDLKFLLDDKLIIEQKCQYFEVIAQIRRLSTESYVTNPWNPVATVWTWYWKDENGIWQEYDVDQSGRNLQRSIEEAFLNNTIFYKFRISDQDYALYFSPRTDMHQENLRYGTIKKVRRRPAEIISGADLELKGSRKVLAAQGRRGKSATSAKFPNHWSSMSHDEQYQRVALTAMSSEYKEVESLFKRTMKNSVIINSIERVQNPFMWEKYQRKKENMMAVKTGGYQRISVNERRLFHGTSPDTVEAICKHNFDWRLHGNNATKYGEGSYFALNASYSHAYAKRDVNSFRFMFLAKVLVGSYIEGYSSDRRPPQKDPSNPASDLYDSCVDDEHNPTIFVVFDTDQFYPEYIIEYSHENVWFSTASNAAYGGIPQTVPNPSRSQAVPYPAASQLYNSQSVAAVKPSRAFGAPTVYSSGSIRKRSHSDTSSGYSSASNTYSTPYQY